MYAEIYLTLAHSYIGMFELSFQHLQFMCKAKKQNKKKKNKESKREIPQYRANKCNEIKKEAGKHAEYTYDQM